LQLFSKNTGYIKRLQKYVKSLRQFRVIHRYIGVALALFLVISSITGVLLSWKKESTLLQPPTQKGTNTNLQTWQPLDQLLEIAQTALINQNGVEAQNNPVDRIDARPSKGIVKVVFEKGYWEVQVDATTGKVLSIARRHSDWIEAIHDGSIISQLFKIISMNILGIGLFILVIAGLWLWYGPKKVRQLKKEK